MKIARTVVAFVALASAAWCRAADDESSGDGSEVADYRAHEEALARRPARSIVDTNTVVRLGYELPDSVVVGAGARQKVYARGILAQCAIYSAKTLQRHLHPKPKPTINYYATLRFGIWWTGDLARSAYSGGDTIYGYSVRDRQVTAQWNGGGEAESNHGTKGSPCLAADILGDWREELLLRRKDNRAIRVYLTPEPTRYRFHTFMEDPVYRWSVATQNNGYNVPAEPGFYFGPELLGSKAPFRGTKLD